MKKVLFFFILLPGIVSLCYGQAQVDTLLNRYRSYLYETEHPLPAHISGWVGTLDPDGRWPDINYKDEHRANWQLWEHLKRLDSLSVAWSNPRSAFYHSGRLHKAIDLALSDWLSHRYRNPNWWHNQIGVPQCMRDIIILLKDTLSAAQIKGALAVMAQLHVQGPGAGANLIWSADLGFHYGALTGDTVLMDSCMHLIVHEIHIGKGEGIQPDYSFHQHGPRLQMYQYGKAFLFADIRLGWEVRGTRWAFPPAKIRILRNFVLQGWQWMARGINAVPGTMDRSASREGELHSPDMGPLLPFLTALDPTEAKAYRALSLRQQGEGSLEGFRYYPYSDFTAYQTRRFSFFLKTISSRTLPTEVGLNSENLKGHLLNNGDAYLIRNGKEYFNLMPVWDWERLPGITAFKGADKIGRKDFAGGVTDGKSGLTAMDYLMLGSGVKDSVSAHKIWACHGGEVVCLLAGLEGGGLDGPAYTVLDQCQLQGAVRVNGQTVKPGERRLRDVKWIFHHGFAYIPLKPAIVALKVGKATGTWQSINASQSSRPVTDSIFMAALVQDSLNGASSGYVLACAQNPRRSARLIRHPDWKVLCNNARCQAVRFRDGTVMVAFFTPGAFQNGRGNRISADMPCLILWSGRGLYASDPLHKGNMLDLTVNGKKWQVRLPADGNTVKIHNR